MKRHEVKYKKIKREKVNHEKYDLIHYKNDRVELLKKMFTILKPNEIECMLPERFRNLPLENLQELCLEELLGISSKRLHAVLDGVDPPSDTNSSSDEPLRHMSLDSISSDEAELHSQSSRNNKKKKRCKRKEGKRKKSKNLDKLLSDGSDEKGGEKAGLTVLELIELQARARAIRAQLHVEQDKKVSAAKSVFEDRDENSDGDEVVIKEEPPEVVDLTSSEDEKPNVTELKKKIECKQPEPSTSTQGGVPSSTVTRTNNLTIIVPKQPTKKIKLNRKKTNYILASEKPYVAPNISIEPKEEAKITHSEVTSTNSKEKKAIDKKRKRKKKRKQKVKAENIDHDEITLQLSDSERQDLLEYLDNEPKKASSSEYTSSDSESDADIDKSKSKNIENMVQYNNGKSDEAKETKESSSGNKTNEISDTNSSRSETNESISNDVVRTTNNQNTVESVKNSDKNDDTSKNKNSNLAKDIIAEKD